MTTFVLVHGAWHSENSVLATFPFMISDRWLEAIIDRQGGFAWAVYAADQ